MYGKMNKEYEAKHRTIPGLMHYCPICESYQTSRHPRSRTDGTSDYIPRHYARDQSALADYNTRRNVSNSPSLSNDDLDTIANALAIHAGNLRVALCKEMAKRDDATYTTKAQDLATQFSAVIKTYRRFVFVDYKNSLISHD